MMSTAARCHVTLQLLLHSNEALTTSARFPGRALVAATLGELTNVCVVYVKGGGVDGLKGDG